MAAPPSQHVLRTTRLHSPSHNHPAHTPTPPPHHHSSTAPLCLPHNASKASTHCNTTTLPTTTLQANWLRAQGIRKGDTVAIYLPMTAELPIAMLACARIGAVHSVVFAGFSAEALAQRVVDAK
jgi:hypothetical protein